MSGGGRIQVWDQQNRLKQVTKNGVTTVRFTYRADGLRARKEVVGGLTIDYVYDGQTVIGEKRSDGKSVWYTPGPNGYLSRTVLNDATGQVLDKEWFVYDGLGSCRAMVKPNAQGTDAVLVARYDYDVYGAVRTQSGSSSNKFKYVAGVGHPTDEETGLLYMRARYYDAGTGRFVSEDPGQDAVNWYVYASNNPINRVDPDGKVDTALWVWWMGLADFWAGVSMSEIAWRIGANFQAMLALTNLVPHGFLWTRTVHVLAVLLQDAKGGKTNASIAQKAISVTLVYKAEIEIWYGLLFSDVNYVFL